LAERGNIRTGAINPKQRPFRGTRRRPWRGVRYFLRSECAVVLFPAVINLLGGRWIPQPARNRWFATSVGRGRL